MQLQENLKEVQASEQPEVRRLRNLAKVQQDKPPVNIGGLSTVELNVNDHVLTGTNGKAIVRNIAKDQYTGPSAQDFLNRGRSLYETALEMLKTDEANAPENLEKLWANFCINIKEQCQIDPENMKSMDSDETLEYFTPIYEQAKSLLTHLSNELCRELLKNQNNLDLPKKVEDVKAMGKILFKTEANRITANGRPNITHFIEVDQNISLVSDQRTLGSTTNTSSKTTESLRNYNEATTAVIRKIQNQDGSTTENITIRDQGRRAGALCAYGEENTLIRHANNAEASRTMLTDAAKDYIAKHGSNSGNSPENPLPLDFFSTTLVSPMFGLASALLQTVKGLPSELQMVSEHNQALMLFNNQPMPIDVNGTIVYVAPQIGHFNIPTNIDKSWISDLVISDKQEQLNAPSLNMYFNKIENYFLNKSNFLFGSIDKIEGVTPEIHNTFNSIALNLNRIINNINNHPDMQTAVNNLKIKMQNTIELPNKQKVSIIEANKELQNLLAQLKENPKNETLKSQYESLTNAIYTYNESINNEYEKIIKKRNELYGQHNEEFESLYSQTLDFLQKNQKFLSTQEGDKVKQDLLALQSYIHCNKLCFNENNEGNYKTRGNAFSLLANMHLSLFNAGITYSYGCKSAEDRTGLLNVNKEAMIQFAEQHGYYPDPVPSKKYLNEKEFHTRSAYNQTFQAHIPNMIYQTASSENTNQNSPGARGLQVPYKISKAMGLLAKGIFKKNSGLEFTETNNLADPDLTIDNNVKQFLLNYNRLQYDRTTTQTKFGITQQMINSQLLQLNQANLSTYNRKILDHHSTNATELNYYIDIATRELKSLQEQVKLENEKRQGNRIKQITDLLSNPLGPPPRKTSHPIDVTLQAKEQELKFLHAFKKEQDELKQLNHYMHGLSDNNGTFSLVHHIAQLEKHEIAAEKNRLNIIENELADLAKIKGEYLPHFDNLDKCKVAILIQEAKYNMLGINLKTEKNESYPLYLNQQKDYALKAKGELEIKNKSGQLRPQESKEIQDQIKRLDNYIAMIGFQHDAKPMRLATEISAKSVITRERSNATVGIPVPPNVGTTPPQSGTQPLVTDTTIATHYSADQRGYNAKSTKSFKLQKEFSSQRIQKDRQPDKENLFNRDRKMPDLPAPPTGTTVVKDGRNLNYAVTVKSKPPATNNKLEPTSLNPLSRR